MMANDWMVCEFNKKGISKILYIYLHLRVSSNSIYNICLAERARNILRNDAEVNKANKIDRSPVFY